MTAKKEGLSQFLSTCPKSYHARTVAHNQGCKVQSLHKYLVAHSTSLVSLHKHLAAHSISLVSLQRNTAQSDTTGLGACPHCNCTAARRQVTDSDTCKVQMSLGRWQPDFMAIFYFNKKTSTRQEVCHQSDVRAEKLDGAPGRMLQTHKP